MNYHVAPSQVLSASAALSHYIPFCYFSLVSSIILCSHAHSYCVLSLHYCCHSLRANNRQFLITQPNFTLSNYSTALCRRGFSEDGYRRVTSFRSGLVICGPQITARRCIYSIPLYDLLHGLMWIRLLDDCMTSIKYSRRRLY